VGGCAHPLRNRVIFSHYLSGVRRVDALYPLVFYQTCPMLHHLPEWVLSTIGALSSTGLIAIQHGDRYMPVVVLSQQSPPGSTRTRWNSLL